MHTYHTPGTYPLQTPYSPAHKTPPHILACRTTSHPGSVTAFSRRDLPCLLQLRCPSATTLVPSPVRAGGTAGRTPTTYACHPCAVAIPPFTPPYKQRAYHMHTPCTSYILPTPPPPHTFIHVRACWRRRGGALTTFKGPPRQCRIQRSFTVASTVAFTSRLNNTTGRIPPGCDGGTRLTRRGAPHQRGHEPTRIGRTKRRR